MSCTVSLLWQTAAWHMPTGQCLAGFDIDTSSDLLQLCEPFVAQLQQPSLTGMQLLYDSGYGHLPSKQQSQIHLQAMVCPLSVRYGWAVRAGPYEKWQQRHEANCSVNIRGYHFVRLTAHMGIPPVQLQPAQHTPWR